MFSSGRQPNKACVFPFKHNNKIHKECTYEGENQAWCSTLVDNSGGSTSHQYCIDRKTSWVTNIAFVLCGSPMFYQNISLIRLPGKHQQGNWGNCGPGCPIPTPVLGIYLCFITTPPKNITAFKFYPRSELW